MPIYLNENFACSMSTSEDRILAHLSYPIAEPLFLHTHGVIEYRVPMVPYIVALRIARMCSSLFKVVFALWIPHPLATPSDRVLKRGAEPRFLTRNCMLRSDCLTWCRLIRSIVTRSLQVLSVIEEAVSDRAAYDSRTTYCAALRLEYEYGRSRRKTKSWWYNSTENRRCSIDLYYNGQCYGEIFV